MPSSDRARRFRWPGALVLAWATSALIVVGDGHEAFVQFLVFAAWISYGWRCAPSRIRAASRRAMACTLVLAVPLQGVAAAERQARGPAHFHVNGSSHFHADARHHHHALADNAVLLDQEEERGAASVIAESRYGVLDGATITRCAVASAVAVDGIRDRPSAAARLHFLPIPERPPRA